MQVIAPLSCKQVVNAVFMSGVIPILKHEKDDDEQSLLASPEASVLFF